MTRVQPVSSAKSSWQFFLSHKQSESAAEALDLTYHLGRNACWLDVHQDDCSVQAMEDGVRNSTFFVCILSTGYLTSMYCLKELWWAFSFEKPIILCYRHMDNIGALLRELPSHSKQKLPKRCRRKHWGQLKMLLLLSICLPRPTRAIP
ncbi:TIR domain-containing protein [Pycnococcus provasolii]